MNKKLALLVALGLFLVVSGSAQAQTFQDIFRGLYTGQGAQANELVELFENIGGFLIVIGGIVAGIALIWSGILYMGSGSNSTRVAAAKAVFKNGLIGALILFTAGIILATIAEFAIDPLGFFS